MSAFSNLPHALRSFAILTGMLLATTAAYGSQDTTQRSLKNQFDRYQQQGIREQIFVHTAKDFQLAGELLWFKVYCVDETYHKPSDLSKVAYLEILDKNNIAVLQAKIALKN